LDSVRELHPWFAGDYMLFMKDGSEVKLSRTYRDHLMQRLEPGK
jgi:DNA-binding LytR/AlgR family response regulator